MIYPKKRQTKKTNQSQPTVTTVAASPKMLLRESPIMYDESYIQRVNESIKELDRLSVMNQQKYKRIKKTGIIISSTIPISVTFSAIEQIAYYEWLKTLLTSYAALGGALMVLMNNVLKTGNFADNWHTYRNMSESLQREKYLYLTKHYPYHGENAFPEFVSRVEEFLEKNNIGKSEKD